LGAAVLHVEIVGQHRDLFDLLDHRQGRPGLKRAMGVNHQACEPWRAEPFPVDLEFVPARWLARKSEESFVVGRGRPLDTGAVLVAVSVRPGVVAPLGSSTVPEMLPVVAAQSIGSVSRIPSKGRTLVERGIPVRQSLAEDPPPLAGGTVFCRSVNDM
jgi:hypothetical protein